MPTKGDPTKKKSAERLAKSLTKDGVLNAMSVDELQGNLKELLSLLEDGSSAIDNTNHQATTSKSIPALETLRQNVKDSAAKVQQQFREARKRYATETRARSENPQITVCHTCGKIPSAGEILKRCAGCYAVSYCTRECQLADWKIHKAKCQEEREGRTEAKKAGVDLKKVKLDDTVLPWYESVPYLADDVAARAWQYRKESPYINVQGGVNAQMAHIAVYPRKFWESNVDIGGYASRFAKHDFHQDTRFFVRVTAGHPGTEHWAQADLLLAFSFPPERMDAWATAHIESFQGAFVGH
jgi:hypothetical protein